MQDVRELLHGPAGDAQRAALPGDVDVVPVLCANCTVRTNDCILSGSVNACGVKKMRENCGWSARIFFSMSATFWSVTPTRTAERGVDVVVELTAVAGERRNDHRRGARAELDDVDSEPTRPQAGDCDREWIPARRGQLDRELHHRSCTCAGVDRALGELAVWRGGDRDGGGPPRRRAIRKRDDDVERTAGHDRLVRRHRLEQQARRRRRPGRSAADGNDGGRESRTDEAF